MRESIKVRKTEREREIEWIITAWYRLVRVFSFLTIHICSNRTAMWHHKISSPQRVSEFSTFVFFVRLLTKQTIVFLFIDIMNYTNNKLIALDANSEFNKFTFIAANIGLLLWYDGNSLCGNIFFDVTANKIRFVICNEWESVHSVHISYVCWTKLWLTYQISKYDFECNEKFIVFRQKQKKIAFCVQNLSDWV